MSTAGKGKKEVMLLLVGKTGNGKSTTGNSIVEAVEEAKGTTFSTGVGFSSNTTKLETAICSGDLGTVKVINTPDLDFVQSEGSDKARDVDDKKQVQEWLEEAGGFPDAVVLVVRADCRYTREEFQIYEKLRRLLKGQVKGAQFCLVVVFTMGDRINGRDLRVDLDDHASKELREVLKDAGQRYVVFDNRADLEDRRASVKALLQMVETKEPHPFPQHVCRVLLLGDAESQLEIARLLCPEAHNKGCPEHFFFGTISEEELPEFRGLKMEVALTLSGEENDRSISPGPHVVLLMTQDAKAPEDIPKKYHRVIDRIVDRRDLLTKVMELVTSNKGSFHRSKEMTRFAKELQITLSRNPKATYQDLLALKTKSGEPKHQEEGGSAV